MALIRSVFNALTSHGDRLAENVWLPEPGSACYRNCSKHLQRIIDKMCMERLLRKGAAHLMLDLDAALHRVAELRGFTLTPKQ